jgi:hypothetical protein
MLFRRNCSSITWATSIGSMASRFGMPLQRQFGVTRHLFRERKDFDLIKNSDRLLNSRIMGHTKKLKSVFNKKMKNLDRRNTKYGKQMEVLVSGIVGKGFTISDDEDNDTVSLTKSFGDKGQSIRIEFEAFPEPEVNKVQLEEEEQVIEFLIEIHIKNSKESSSFDSLVFTITPEPIPSFMSVRLVPVGKEISDQSVYDGPNLLLRSYGISQSLWAFLEERGIDDALIENIQDYAHIKYELGKSYTLRKVVENIIPTISY